MTPHPTPDFYLSLFLFCDDLQPQDQGARQQTVWRVQQLQAMGYRGVEIPIAATDLQDPRQELEHYRLLRQELDAAGCAEVAITTNVAATARFDPTAESGEQRRQALAYLRSRVEITAALRGTVMMGPLVFPYAQRPLGADGALLWSDALQASWPRACDRARAGLEALAQQASELQVKLAIEPMASVPGGSRSVVRLVRLVIALPFQPNVKIWLVQKSVTKYRPWKLHSALPR